MTSPHAASEEAVAIMATAAFNDSPTNIDLTADDVVVPTANSTGATTAQENGTQEHREDVTAIEKLQISTEDASIESNIESTIPQTPPFQCQSNVIMEPAIPRTPENNGDDAEYPRVPLADYQQLQALSHMLQYQAQPGLVEDLNGSAMATLARNGIPMESAHDPNEPYSEIPQPARDNDETRISAYALLEFEDGQFYMNTYSVILGRDRAAARTAMRRDAEESKASVGDPSATGEPKTPVRIKREESRYTKSVISESGGILRDGDDSDSDERSRRRMHRKASKKSKSTGSSSHRISRRQSLVHPNGKIDYQAQPQPRRHAAETAGAVPVDPASLRPSPYDCPLVGIHPPATTPASGYKAISRRHVKIAYNSKKCLFEAEIIGRNGAFVDEVFYYHQDVIPLKSGSFLQIGGVVVRFVLPDVALGETGAEIPVDQEEAIVQDRYVEGGKEMSFDFDDATREGALLRDSSDEASDEADQPKMGIEGGDDDDDEGEDEIRDPQEESGNDEDNSDLSDVPDELENENMEQDEQVKETPESLPMPQKKRGPGRPPKNGIMSKREQQLAKKEAQQRAAQKSISQPDTSGKNKVGRPRKNPVDESPVKTEKRKYTKRKPKDPDSLAAKQDGSGDDDRPSKEKKEKKSTKPPRSPSPTFNEADLTPEQLAKPQANYVTLIHEALSNSPTGQMSLPQIYRAIQRRYPFFVLKCNTNGWQSSVRHNLSQHHAFRKVERDGKGWMWAIVDGVSIEKEKKRRPTPPHQLPPHLHQPIYRAGPHPHMMHGPPGMMPPPGYAMNHMPPHLRPGQPPQYVGQPMNGYPLPPGQHPMSGAQPSGFSSVLPLTQPMGATSNTYSSPYAPKPPANPAQQAPPSTPHNHSQTPPQSVPYQTPQQPRPIEQGPPQPDNAMWRAIESFRNNLVATMKPKNNKAEALVASSINRVMGVTSQSTATVVESDLKLEDQIMAALKEMLKRFPEFNNGTFQHPPGQGTLPTQQNLHQNETAPRQALAQITPASTGNSTHTVPDTSTTKKGSTVGPAVQRPTFTGQAHNRLNGGSVPRPPMMTPGMTRANSGSSANPSFRATTSASPAPPPAANPVPAPNDLAQHLGSNVHSTEHTENLQTPPQQPAANSELSGAGIQRLPTPIVQASAAATIQQLGSDNPTTITNENGKRPLGEDEMTGENDFKRLNASGPPALKA